MKHLGEFLVLGATMRLTRLVVTDDIGKWFIRNPARSWANSHELPINQWTGDVENATNPDNGWRSKLVSGLDCPFCAGFWIGVLVLLTYKLFGKTALWRFVAGALTLNEITGHVGARLGDAGYGED